MASPPDDVTLGEIARNVAALRSDMREDFDKVNRRFDTLEYVPRGEHNLQMRELSDRLSVLEDNRKWMSRTLVASFLYPLLLAVVVATVVLK